jgi:ribonucleoside-diphosphate reductase alpha chain
MHTSAELARVRKPYKFFHKCKSSTYEVFHRHLQAAEKLANSTGLPLAEQAYRELANAIKTVHKYGIRNAQLTAIAPTGTISLLMDCQTTGIEPEYSLLKEKTLVGGEMMKFTNNAIEPALASLGYNSNARSKIISHIMNTGTIEGCSHLNEEHLAVFDCAIPNQPGGRFISADGHLKMLAACQPFVSGGISKTINLPHHATPKEIETIYFKAWQLGLKSVAVYRDQSKSVQPLNLRAEGKCSSCGGKMVAAGNCYTCTECGDSTSCQS